MTEGHSEPSDEDAALDLRILRRSDYFMLALAQAHGVMLLRRTAATFPDIRTVEDEVQSVVTPFKGYRRTPLVLDMRAARPNNDPAFEDAMRLLRHAMGQNFARVVVLVSSASGEMQVGRLHRSEKLPYLVTRDARGVWSLATQ